MDIRGWDRFAIEGWEGQRAVRVANVSFAEPIAKHGRTGCDSGLKITASKAASWDRINNVVVAGYNQGAGRVESNICPLR